MKVMAPEVSGRLAEAADGQVREAGSDDVVDGMPARWVVSPRDAAAVSRVMAAAYDLGLAVVPRGAGTRLSWGARPDPLDVILDLGPLDELVEHTPGDLVAVVQAGLRLDDLEKRLAEAGQRLAVDPPRRGTVGGLVASAATGPVRLSAGPVRDLVIGVTMVRADGVLAKAGGKVVKNVAGYDLGKLLTGSFGTLGVITQVALRLHPVTEVSRWASVPVRSAQEAQAMVLRVAHSQLVPSGCELDWRDGSGELAVRVDGLTHGVEDHIALALELLGPQSAGSSSAPEWWGTEPAGEVLLKVTHEVASLAAVLEAAQGLAVRGSAAVGTLYASVPPADGSTGTNGRNDADRPENGVGARRAGSAADVVARLRAAAPSFGGAVVVLEAPAEVQAAVDVWGPVRGLDLMRRVKDQFDPTRVLSPGRFVGGI